MYRLLSHPEYIEPLRQEVEAVVAEKGWTKAGMDKMRKIDSFVRETQRIDPDGLGLLVSSRCFSVADICLVSDVSTPYFTPLHVLQRRNHPGEYISGAPAQCYRYE